MKTFGRYLLALSVVAGSAAPAANLSAPAQSDEIIVQGKKLDRSEVDRFVSALTPAPAGGQIGRFELAACPVAIGLEPQQNEAIARRLRAVAAAAGVPVGKPGCQANLFVVSSWEPQSLIAAWRKKYPAYFENLTGPVRLSDPDGPAIAWHVEGRRTEDGVDAEIAYNVECGCKYYRPSTTSAGRLKTVTRPHFLVGVLVLDKKVIGGLTTTQVADYAAMRLLARTEPARLGKSAVPTILSLIDAPADSMVPVTMTDWDFSFLKSLYGSGENQFASSQRGQIQRLMRKDLAGSKAGKDR